MPAYREYSRIRGRSIATGCSREMTAYFWRRTLGCRAVPAARRPPAALAATLAALALALAGCGDDDPGAARPAGTDSGGGAACADRPPSEEPSPATYSEPPPTVIEEAATYTATLATSCGDIVIELDAELAPMTVNNFVFLSREGFYDGLSFHRVAAGFVIQGGDPEGTGRGGPGYSFPDELPTDGYPPGSVAMANSGPDTNGSQFFIVTGDASALPNDYTRFGRVVDGLDVARLVEGLADPDADPFDPSTQRPTREVFIDSVRIEETPA